MAHTETWNGSTDLYSNAADWTPDNIVPGFGDTAIVPSGTVELTGALNGVSLELGDTTGQGLLPTLATTNATLGSSLSISDIPNGGTFQVTVDGTLADSGAILITNFGSDLVVNNAAGTSSTFDQAAGSVTVTSGELDLNTASVELAADISVSSAGLLVVNNFNPNQTAVTLQGSGLVDLAAASTFEDLAAATSGITVQFDDATDDVLMIGGTFTGSVTGFDVNNVVDFTLIPAADAATWSNGVLTLTSAGVPVASINLTGPSITSNTKFTVTSDNNGGVQVSVAPAYITGVTATPATADLGVGGTATLTLAASAPLQVNTLNGTPTLSLNDGGAATYDAAASSGANLVFDYTVAAGDNTADLAVTAVNLNGATITDDAGGNANLSGAVANPAGTLEVDTTPPTVTPATLTVAGGSNATPIGIVAPTDAGSTAAQLIVVVDTLPTDGYVHLADGVTAVTVGETLTTAQLAGLTFTPTSNGTNPSSNFAYSVTDPAGNVASGSATLDVSSSETWNGANAPFGTASDWSGGVVPGIGDTAIIPSGTVSLTGMSNGVAFELGDTTGQGLLPTLATTDATLGSLSSISDIANGGTSQISVTGTLVDMGSILVTNFGSDLVINNAAGVSGSFVSPSGSIIINAGELDLNTASVTVNTDVSVSNSGLLVVNNFSPEQTPVTFVGGGTIDLSSDSTFEDFATNTAGPTVQFDDATDDTFVLGGGYTGGALNGLVTGFDVNNVLDFANIAAATSAVYSGSDLFLINNGMTVATVALTGPNINANTAFTISSDNSGGVDVTVAPAFVTGVTANPATSIIGLGQMATLTVAMSSALQVNTLNGTPTLSLNDGETATYDPVASSGANLVFDYTVAAGDNTPDLTVTAFNLNGATITDDAGRAANLSGAVTNPAGTLQIDTVPPVVTPTTLTVAGGSNATPIGIAAPTDSVFTAAQLVATVTALPIDGYVHLADGVTAVTVGETLTTAQLTGLTFTPTSNSTNPSSTFSYSVADPAGNVTAGNATLNVSTSETWNGATAPFATAADWSGGVVPGFGDTAIIPTGVVQIAGALNGVSIALGNPTAGGAAPILTATNATLGSSLSISDVAGDGMSVIAVNGTLTDSATILLTHVGSQFLVDNSGSTADVFNQAAGSIIVTGAALDLNTATVQVGAAISVSSGALVVNQSGTNTGPATLQGTGTIDLAAGSTFYDLASSTTGVTVQFDDTTKDDLILGGAFTGSVTGFDVDNVLDFTRIAAADGASWANGVLTLTKAGVAVGTINLTGPNITSKTSFTVTPDGTGGVAVSVAPSTVVAVTATTPSAPLTVGTTAVITVATSGNVSVNTLGGVPTLSLNDGGTATYDATNSTANNLVFDYTVTAGQTTTALAVTAVNLNGATVTDDGGVAANLSGAVGTIPGSLAVTAQPPTAPVITTGSEVTNTATPIIAGTAQAGVTVTAYDAGVSIGSTVAARERYVHGGPEEPQPRRNTVTTIATSTNGTSAASAAVSIYDLPAPINGTTVANISSATLAHVLGAGTLNFISGTQQVQLVDGTLSVGTNTEAATIDRLYIGLLGRPADQAGLSFYEQALSSGASTSAVANNILSSPEFQAVHPGITDAQFVTTLYQNDLGRTDSLPDYWTNALAQGASRADVAASIANSAEAQAHLAGQTSNLFAIDPAGIIVHELFETGLGREVDPAALAADKTALATATPLQLAQSITGSAEFTALHGGQSNAAFVTSLYEAGLGRAPDAAGGAYWTNLLNAGASRANVLMGIASSTEGAAILTHPQV